MTIEINGQQAYSIYPGALPKPVYIAEYTFSTAQPHTVKFIPVRSVPGYTHRVIIDDNAVDWLGYGKPNTKAAEYFLRKHWDRPCA